MKYLQLWDEKKKKKRCLTWPGRQGIDAVIQTEKCFTLKPFSLLGSLVHLSLKLKTQEFSSAASFRHLSIQSWHSSIHFMSKVSPDLCFPCLWDISLVQVFISLANQHSHITHCFSSLPDLPLSNYFSYSDSVAWKILQDQALPYISILSFAQPPSPLPAHQFVLCI